MPHLAAGMIGCVRKVELGGEPVDLRSLVGTNVAHKDVTYDGCMVSVFVLLSDATHSRGRLSCGAHLTNLA